MGKKNKTSYALKGAEKTAMKVDKKQEAKHKKMLERLGERDIAEVVAALEQEQIRLLSVVEHQCEAPSARSNFTLVAHPNQEELILFGGELYNGKQVTVYNDLFFYNVNGKTWRQLSAPGGPAPRSGHQMVSVPVDGGQLWLFGGEHASPSQLQFYHYNDLWMFSLQSKKWQKVEATNGPSARSGHRMIVHQTRLIIFGGFYDNYSSYCYYNDVHIFDMVQRVWQPVQVEGFLKPSARSGCCMSVCPDGKVLVWGGYVKTALRKRVEHGHTFTDMFALMPKTEAGDSIHWQWSLIQPTGHKMPPLNSVACTTASNGKAYCFGGVVDTDEDDEDLYGQFTQELYALNLEQLSWQLCEIGEQQTASDAMQTTAVQPTTITSTDGRFSVTVGAAGAASKTAASYLAMPSLFRKQSRYAPTPRMNAGLCVLNGILYVYGGLFEEKDRLYTYRDFFSLDLAETKAWKVIIPNDDNAHDWLESDDDDADKTIDEDDDDDDDDDDESDDTENETVADEMETTKEKNTEFDMELG